LQSDESPVLSTPEGLSAHFFEGPSVMHNTSDPTRLEPALVSIPAGCEFLAVSPAEMYRLLGLGKIEAVKAGKRTLLSVPSLKAHAASLPAAKIKPPVGRKRA
jgi:hypothetical protein